MRRTTLVIISILFVGLGSLLFAMKTYTGQFLEEIQRAKEVTTAVRERLAPGTSVKLARVVGQAKYVVTDGTRPGLLVEAEPLAEVWKTDPQGRGFARDLWIRLEALYGPDRPVNWMQFRLTRPDKTEEPIFGFERGGLGETRWIPRAPGG
jgi:hypothetical protein